MPGATAQLAIVCVLGAVGAAGCAGSAGDAGDSDPDIASVVASDPASVDIQRFPDVIAATATRADEGWAFDVTISSPYDTPDRYADAWRIVGPDGTVYGVRELTHDHAAEQPFTRSLRGVTIPDDVAAVTIEGRDQEYGWGGATVEVALAP